MKKIFMSSIFTSFIILTFIINPSVSHASWWNPGTWFNNWSFNSSKVEKVDDKIDVPNVDSVSTDVQTTNQDQQKTTLAPNVTVFGSDDSIKKGQVLTSQQKIVKQIITKATSTATEKVTIKNCMGNFQCIVEAAKTCLPAKADVTTTVDIGKMFAPPAPDPSKIPSVMQTQTNHYEIRGFTNDKCVYYSKLIDIKNPNLPPEGVKSLLAQAGEIKCSYSTSDLVARLKNVQIGNGSGSFSSSDTSAERNVRQCRELGVSSDGN